MITWFCFVLKFFYSLQSKKTLWECTLNILISLLILTLLYSDSLSFSDDVASTTRTGRTRRRICRSGKRRAKSNSNDSTAKTIRTCRISSTLVRVKDLKNNQICIVLPFKSKLMGQITFWCCRQSISSITM